MSGTRKRILLVNHVAEMGGAEHGLLDIAASANRTEFEFAAALPDRGELSDELERLDVKVHYLPFQRFRKTLNPLALGGYAINLAQTIPLLAQLLRREKIDLVHANSNTAQIYAAPAARRAGVQSVMHCRDLVSLGPLGRWLCSGSARVICVSGAVERHLAKYCSDKSRLLRIYNGIDTQKFAPHPPATHFRAEAGFGRNDIVIGNVGQIVPWKNQDVFIRSAALVAKEEPRARFVIMGNTSLDNIKWERTLRRLAADQGLEGKLFFAGYRSNIPEIVPELDFLIHAAAAEPFGRAIAEVMAMEKPVVAVGSAGPGEIIQDGLNGLLVPAPDAGLLARAALELCRDTQLRTRLSVAARQRIAQSFNIIESVSRIESVYRALTGDQSLDNKRQ